MFKKKSKHDFGRFRTFEAQIRIIPDTIWKIINCNANVNGNQFFCFFLTRFPHPDPDLDPDHLSDLSPPQFAVSVPNEFLQPNSPQITFDFSIFYNREELPTASLFVIVFEGEKDGRTVTHRTWIHLSDAEVSSLPRTIYSTIPDVRTIRIAYHSVRLSPMVCAKPSIVG